MLLPNSAPGSGRSTPNGWVWILAYGIGTIILGVFALANPVVAGLAAGLVTGITLTAYGVLAIIAGVSARPTAGWTIPFGVLAALAGVLILFDPFAGALSVVFLIGVWLVLAGIFQLWIAFRNASGRGWNLLLGVLDLVLGLAVLFADPVSALGFLAAAVGISLLFRGSLLLAVALGLRRLGRAR